MAPRIPSPFNRQSPWFSRASLLPSGAGNNVGNAFLDSLVEEWIIKIVRFIRRRIVENDSGSRGDLGGSGLSPENDRPQLPQRVDKTLHERPWPKIFQLI
jgi:hypothetical protein